MTEKKILTVPAIACPGCLETILIDATKHKNGKVKLKCDKCGAKVIADLQMKLFDTEELMWGDAEVVFPGKKESA